MLCSVSAQPEGTDWSYLSRIQQCTAVFSQSMFYELLIPKDAPRVESSMVT